MTHPNLMTIAELSIIRAKLSLLHRTLEDWDAIKAILLNRDVFVMESKLLPSKGHMTDGSMLTFCTMMRRTNWMVDLRTTIAELQKQLTDLCNHIKALRSDVHNEARLARKAEKALDEGKEHVRLDRQELASLRELVLHSSDADDG